MNQNPRELLLGMAQHCYERFAVNRKLAARAEREMIDARNNATSAENEYEALAMLLKRYGIKLFSPQWLMEQETKGVPYEPAFEVPEDLVGELGIPPEALGKELGKAWRKVKDVDPPST